MNKDIFNHIYSEKPKMSIGDFSIECESDNDSKEEKNINKLNSKNLNEESLEFPKGNVITSLSISNNEDQVQKEANIPPINIPFNDIDNSHQNKNPIFYSLTSDTDNKFENKDSNEIKEDFTILKRVNYSKENDRYERYNSNISEIYNNNFRFFSSFEDDYNEEDDDIVNNEITSIMDNDNNEEKNENFDDNNNIKNSDSLKGFNATYNFNKDDNKVEVILHPDIFKIYNNDENDHNKKNNNNTMNNNKLSLEKKNNNIIDLSGSDFGEIKNNENIRYKDIDIDNNSNEINNENNENNISKKINEKKQNININNIKENNIQIQNKTNINNYKKIIDNNKNNNNIINKNDSKEFKRKITILNLTKQNKIFQKFLCVSVDTSGLYSLDDEMKTLLLNPKITYNYPYNKMERELE